MKTTLAFLVGMVIAIFGTLSVDRYSDSVLGYFNLIQKQPESIKINKKEGGPSVVNFTDKNEKIIGQLVIGENIGFSGELEASGLIFMSYISTNLGLHCEELKAKSPIQKPATETPAKK